jgi:P2 phage tail completion protein R (GpR)
MRKPSSLRDFLTRSIADLANDPDRLHLFIEDGEILAGQSTSLSYEYRYQLVVVVEDFATGSESLIVPLLAWIAENQPDIFNKSEGRIPFVSDILGNDKSDIEIRLSLSERAIVIARDGGGWEVAFPPEPGFSDLFPGAQGARLWQLFLRDQLIAQAVFGAGEDPVP